MRAALLRRTACLLGPAVERSPVCVLRPLKQPLPTAALGRQQLQLHSSAPTTPVRSRNAEKQRKAKDWKRSLEGLQLGEDTLGDFSEFLDFEGLTSIFFLMTFKLYIHVK